MGHNGRKPWRRNSKLMAITAIHQCRVTELDNGEFHPAAMKIVAKGRKSWCTDKSGVTFREQNNHTAPVGELMLLQRRGGFPLFLRSCFFIIKTCATFYPNDAHVLN